MKKAEKSSQVIAWANLMPRGEGTLFIVNACPFCGKVHVHDSEGEATPHCDPNDYSGERYVVNPFPADRNQGTAIGEWQDETSSVMAPMIAIVALAYSVKDVIEAEGVAKHNAAARSKATGSSSSWVYAFDTMRRWVLDNRNHPYLGCHSRLIAFYVPERYLSHQDGDLSLSRHPSEIEIPF